MSARFNSKPIDDLIGYMDSYQQIANEEMNNALKVIEPLALAELQVEPGKPNYPIQWQSEKQRRAFFATDGFGGGIPHVRTHDLSKAWMIVKTATGGDIVVQIANPRPEAKFVYGSLSYTNPGRFQQRMHQGRWDAGETVNFWMEAIAEQFIDNMRQRLGELAGGTTVKQRAYTGRRR